MTYGVHNVIHLQITQNIVLPIVLYLSKDKVDWYNENNIHPLVLKALRPVIVEHYNQEKNASLNKKKKDSDTNQIIDLEECRLLYRFVPHKTHTKLIVTEHEFEFQEEDEKPITKTNYIGKTLYPYQLYVSVDDPLFTSKVNTLDSYFTSLVSG